MTKFVRVREPGKHALLHPESGLHITPRAEELFDVKDPLVKAHPWAFATDQELSDAAQLAIDQQATSEPVRAESELHKPAPSEEVVPGEEAPVGDFGDPNNDMPDGGPLGEDEAKTAGPTRGVTRPRPPMTDEEREAAEKAEREQDDAPVEDASAEPGKKRATKRT